MKMKKYFTLKMGKVLFFLCKVCYTGTIFIKIVSPMTPLLIFTLIIITIISKIRTTMGGHEAINPRIHWESETTLKKYRKTNQRFSIKKLFILYLKITILDTLTILFDKNFIHEQKKEQMFEKNVKINIWSSQNNDRSNLLTVFYFFEE